MTKKSSSSDACWGHYINIKYLGVRCLSNDFQRGAIWQREESLNHDHYVFLAPRKLWIHAVAASGTLTFLKRYFFLLRLLWVWSFKKYTFSLLRSLWSWKKYFFLLRLLWSWKKILFLFSVYFDLLKKILFLFSVYFGLEKNTFSLLRLLWSLKKVPFLFSV